MLNVISFHWAAECYHSNQQTNKKDEKKNNLYSHKDSVCLFWKAGACSTSLKIFIALGFTNTKCKKFQKHRFSFGVNVYVAV